MKTSLSSLASEVTVWTKQVTRDLLNDVGREAFKICFGEYASAKWKASKNPNLPPKPSRFGGDLAATGGPRYFTISRDATGSDESTLIHELMAYATHGTPQQGLFMMWDLSLPHQRVSARTWMKNMSITDAIPDGPGLFLLFMPVGGIPHPFASKHGFDGSMGVYVHFTVNRLSLKRVIDLRHPEIAEAFLKQTTQLLGFPFKEPLKTFEELLPTILTQELGGGHGFSLVVGRALRKAGIDGLIYPSARTDAYVQVDGGSVVDSGGWLLVDYRYAGEPDIAMAIDFEPWRDWIGRLMPDETRWVYDGVHINYSRSGQTKGSWSVDGLADWQEALYEASFIMPVLEALGSEVLDEMRVVLATILLPLAFKSSLKLHNLAVRLQLAALGDEEQKDRWKQTAEQFAEGGMHETAFIIRRFVAACP